MAAMDPARVSIQPTSHESVIGPDMSARQSLRIPAPRGPRPAPARPCRADSEKIVERG
jgi:hypothetical protein